MERRALTCGCVMIEEPKGRLIVFEKPSCKEQLLNVMFCCWTMEGLGAYRVRGGVDVRGMRRAFDESSYIKLVSSAE